MPERSERALCVAVLAFGAALRLIQYFGRPSFWIDELALARNIQSFPLARLIRGPLAFQQSAPPGFLALEKIMARFLGAGELSLRVLPLAASIFCLFLFFRLLEQCRLAPPALLGGCILFALAPGLTFYGTELKQYSFDMMFSTLLTLLAIRTLEAENPFGIALIAAGIVAPWFSNQSVFVIAAICPAILATRGRDARQRASATLSVAVLSL
ncbi:MAG: glycosyltransferase family 39 protein, partial [Thermoanaerobaculia bacterium]